MGILSLISIFESTENKIIYLFANGQPTINYNTGKQVVSEGYNLKYYTKRKLLMLGLHLALLVNVGIQIQFLT